MEATSYTASTGDDEDDAEADAATDAAIGRRLVLGTPPGSAELCSMSSRPRFYNPK